MISSLILPALQRVFQLPRRLQSVVGSYLFSLMLDAPRHTQRFASSISGLDRSQYCRLLKQHPETAENCLREAARHSLDQGSSEDKKTRSEIVAGSPWKIGIIIDATLHPRSSLHVQNSQRFNHGEGWVIGHQWTNIVLVVNDEVIPLPPIPFVSKNECRKQGIAYQTEHEKILDYLKALRLRDWVGDHQSSEVVVLCDSGYDNKKIQKLCMGRGWDLIGALKPQRGAQSWFEEKPESRKFRRIDELFRATKKQAPWETVRDFVSSSGSIGKKRKEFRARQLKGRLKGIRRVVTLVCSEKSKGKGRIYLVCSNVNVSLGVIVRTYRRRWLVELFHRAVKGSFGMQDAGVENFQSQQSHVHWVYCAYLLLPKLDPSLSKAGPVLGQRKLRAHWESEKLRHIIELSRGKGGGRKVRQFCAELLEHAQAA